MKSKKEKSNDKLEKIKKNIEESYLYFRENYNSWHTSHKFVFLSALSQDDRNILTRLLKPHLEFNSLEAYISRLRGEFSKQIPSISVSADMESNLTPELTQFVEDHLRHVFYEANKNNCEYDSYTRTMAGGFDVLKVWTEYANSMSFNQVIKFGRVFDPTLCGFDPLAVLDHKGDGRFCFEMYVKTKDEFEEEFPNIDTSRIVFGKSNFDGFNWSYSTRKEKIILMVDYFEKEKKKEIIVKLNNGKVMKLNDYNSFIDRNIENNLLTEELPVVVSKRETDFEIIHRYRLIEDQIIEHIETDFSHLPLVFVDGNSVTCRETISGDVKQYTRPYIYNAMGAQKLKNFAGQTLAHEIENMQQSKLKIPLEAMPEQQEYMEAYKNPQLMSLYVYKQFRDRDATVRLDPPQEVIRTQTPPEVMQAFSGADSIIQSVLGSYDASLGINNNQLSGIAVVESATQSNAAAMPYVVSLMHALSRIAEIYVDLLPKYYVTPRSMPIIDSEGRRTFVMVNQPNEFGNSINLDYEGNIFNVKVEAGVNYSIQKSRAVNQIIELMRAVPNSTLGKFLESEAIPIILDNIEIRGVDKLKAMAIRFIEEEKAKQQQIQEQMEYQLQMDPNVITAQAYRDKIALQTKQSAIDNQLKVADLAIKQEKNENDFIKTLSQIEESKRDDLIQLDKHNAEKTRAAVDLAIKASQFQHTKHKDLLNAIQKS